MKTIFHPEAEEEFIAAVRQYSDIDLSFGALSVNVITRLRVSEVMMVPGWLKEDGSDAMFAMVGTVLGLYLMEVSGVRDWVAEAMDARQLYTVS